MNPTDREIEMALANKLFGWSEDECDGQILVTDLRQQSCERRPAGETVKPIDERLHRHVPAYYTESLDRAYDVMRAMLERGWRFACSTDPAVEQVHYVVTFSRRLQRQSVYAEGDSLAKAICRAAFRALRKERGVAA